jgi:hypothetical protein
VDPRHLVLDPAAGVVPDLASRAKVYHSLQADLADQYLDVRSDQGGQKLAAEQPTPAGPPPIRCGEIA